MTSFKSWNKNWQYALFLKRPPFKTEIILEVLYIET